MRQARRAPARRRGVRPAPGRAPRAALPGTIWYHAPGDRALVRLAGGATPRFRSPGGDLFPSAAPLPDGRLVALRSRGDGGADSEQVVLVAADGALAPIGPIAAQVRDPAVDPAGRWIVVAVNHDGRSDLARIDLPGGETAPITNNPEGNFRPAPLGDDVVFVSSRDGDAEIYRMPARGGAAQRLTAFHRDDWEPAPSPDGKTLAFLSDREGRPRIFLVAADGTGARRLSDRPARDDRREEAEPAWSPDGAHLAYVVEDGPARTVWIHELATGRARMLSPPDAYDAMPAWSPDGAWLLVARGAGHDTELWALPAAGGAPLQVAAEPGGARVPRWLP